MPILISKAFPGLEKSKPHHPGSNWDTNTNMNDDTKYKVLIQIWKKTYRGVPLEYQVISGVGYCNNWDMKSYILWEINFKSDTPVKNYSFL